MRQLLYVSSTDSSLTPGELDDILSSSREKNARTGVTGLLLHIDGGFLQILEGEQRTVHELYARIRADRRHRGPQLMLDREVQARTFTGWSMGFECPTPDDAETAGMFGVAREAILGRLTPRVGHVVAMMLETFYRIQRDDTLRLAEVRAS